MSTQAANRSVGFDLCERLKSAAQSEVPAKGAMGFVSGGARVWRVEG